MALLFHHGAQGQFLPSLQANDPVEFDDYLAILHAKAPAARLTAATNFETAWPESELLPHVYELRFEAQRENGNAAAAIREGKRALDAAPANVTVAVRLAAILATTGQLEEAERLLAQADSVLTSFRVPRTVPFPEWQARRSWIAARQAAARGLIAFKRDRIPQAVAHFEEAIHVSPEPADHLRLGRLYKLTGRTQDARRQFERAAATGDEELKRLAVAELHSQ